MRYLLDTHTLLWALSDPETLSAESRGILEGDETHIFVSLVSLWECVIKSSIGKLTIPDDFFDVVSNGFEVLPVEIAHLERYLLLPLLHRDPFDRMLVSQALVGDLILISRDKEIGRYDVKLVRA